MQKQNETSHLSNFSLYQGLANHNSWAKTGLLPVFVSKVLLDHSHTNIIYILSMLLSYYSDNLKVLWKRVYVCKSLQYLLSAPLRNKVADPQGPHPPVYTNISPNVPSVRWPHWNILYSQAWELQIKQGSEKSLTGHHRSLNLPLWLVSNTRLMDGIL